MYYSTYNIIFNHRVLTHYKIISRIKEEDPIRNKNFILNCLDENPIMEKDDDVVRIKGKRYLKDSLDIVLVKEEKK